MDIRTELHEQIDALRRSHDLYIEAATALIREYETRISSADRQLFRSHETLERINRILAC